MPRRSLFIVVSFLLVGLVAASTPLLAADSIRDVQARLQEKGFDPGPVDGMMGPKTREAIRAFQTANGLPATGRLDEETQKKLGVELTEIVVPAGTRMQVWLNDRLSSGTARVGDRFTMTVAEAVAIGDAVAIPRGAVITGTVTEVEPAERPQKGGRLALRADRVSVRGNSYALSGEVTAEQRQLEGEGSLREDLTRIGVGAAAGGALGGLLGGRRGVLAGIAIGGGGVFLATRGEQVELPPETRLIVALNQGLSLQAR